MSWPIPEKDHCGGGSRQDACVAFGLNVMACVRGPCRWAARIGAYIGCSDASRRGR